MTDGNVRLSKFRPFDWLWHYFERDDIYSNLSKNPNSGTYEKGNLKVAHAFSRSPLPVLNSTNQNLQNSSAIVVPLL